MIVSIFKNDFLIDNDCSKNPDCLGVFEITEAQKIQLENGADFKIIDEKLIITDNEISLKVIKKENLEKMTELELLETSETFGDLEFSGKDKGDFLIKKQLDGNPHKESQYARLFDATILEFLINEFDFLNKIPADKKLFIEFLMKKSQDTEIILKKFN